MKNPINVCNNVSLILDTYKRLFFQTFGEALWCCWTALTVQDNSARQRGNGKVLESASFEIPILISELVYELCNI